MFLCTNSTLSFLFQESKQTRANAQIAGQGRRSSQPGTNDDTPLASSSKLYYFCGFMGLYGRVQLPLYFCIVACLKFCFFLTREYHC